MKELIENFGGLFFFIAFIVLVFVAQIFLIRWVLRINDMVFYLEKINEKLRKICEERAVTNSEIKK